MVASYRLAEGKTVKIPYRGSRNTVQSILGELGTMTYIGVRQLSLPKCTYL